MKDFTTTKLTSGFSLLEIMVTVAIIGMLATLAVPAIREATQNAQVMRTVSDMRQYSSAISTYNLANGEYPEDKTPGEMPEGMEEIMPPQWLAAAPVGGSWDWDYEQFGTKAAVSIYADNALTPKTIYSWYRIDKTLDDGFLGAGLVRIRPGGLMFVIDEGSGGGSIFGSNGTGG
ncbi:prepilin-type N-terminal cleavage/methylation domain-containing protein [Rubellicoccus peritrichatus]|uniref:Prepilin-type N-terminal cleavage/methylation domain-containing protein n=1 Tax=Rubellicoccus peritrichatus TaxID=3080537 RepID=A0AAQ3L6T5_9BACT|nr:prepilin-type N-terminal cleavage/methylation domain-containing protein [Puniceicoccus sp. CR14]WOO40121.1 prepilin-type N-terminal cleavage/methylation domain-containing protein [Puniceicoccus sp. CR14]